MRLCTLIQVNGAELIRKLSKVAQRTGTRVEFVAAHGKGSHGRLYYGNAFTTLKDRKKEIGPGLLAKMLRDLGLSKRDLEG